MRARLNRLLKGAILAVVVVAGLAAGQSRATPSSGSTGPAVSSAAAVGHKVYVPQAMRASAEPNPGVPSEPASATFWLPTKDVDNTGIATNNPQVAVDRSGGIHVAYRISARETQGAWPAFYMYCAAQCADPTRWSRTRLSDDVVDVRLQVDPAGQPRLLLTAYSEHQPYDWLQMKELQYAACDGGCADPANWTITPVATTFHADMYSADKSNQRFTLDRQGRPGFIYVDSRNPQEHNGTFYAYCGRANPGECRKTANWQETRVSLQNLGAAELVYTGAGNARILGSYSPDGYAVKLVYIECDATCNALDYETLWDTDGYAHWSLKLDRSDRPRLVLYSGWYLKDIPALQTYYVWCDGNCLNVGSWRRTTLIPNVSAPMAVDLELDGNDRPRFVFKTGDQGPSYAWCNAACESDEGKWQAKLIEASNVLDQLYPVPVPTDCTESRWASGYIPTLALDPAGNPRVTFVAQHFTSGVHRDGRRCDGQVDIVWARFSMFPAP